MKWELKFNKICYINNNKEQKIDDVYVNLDPSSYLIKAPEIYFESIIDNYFKKFLDEEICQFNYLDEYISINCDKSEKFSIPFGLPSGTARATLFSSRLILVPSRTKSFLSGLSFSSLLESS